MRLRPERGREIGGMTLRRDGGTFVCHLTTHDADEHDSAENQ